MTLRTLFAICLLVLVAGCVNLGEGTHQPTRSYLLEARVPAMAPTGTDGTLGLGPVALPAYLDRNQVVLRAGEGRLELLPFDRWAEPLDAGLARVLAENLLGRLPLQAVRVYPWRQSEAPERWISLRLLRFDGGDGQAQLHLTWSLHRRGETAPLLERTVRYQRPLPAPTAAALAPVLSDLAGDLADDLAAALHP